MAIDTHYSFWAGGSTATSAATAHNIYGTYNGLSNLSASEVLVIRVYASGGDLRLSLDPTVGATNDSPFRLFVSSSGLDLSRMSVANASQITFARETANNPVAIWHIMRRIP